MIEFFSNSGFVTILVIAWLSLYFIGTFWVFIYRWFVLQGTLSHEEDSLMMLLNDSIKIPNSAIFSDKLKREVLSKEMLTVWKNQILKNNSTGLVFLGIVSSTAPFIGLFGTVVEILEAFSKLGAGGSSFEVIAPVISKALIATACGILSAIPAYSFYLVLKRKIQELSICLQTQIDVSLASKS